MIFNKYQCLRSFAEFLLKTAFKKEGLHYNSLCDTFNTEFLQEDWDGMGFNRNKYFKLEV